MNAIRPALRRYSVTQASSPSTRISKRWRSGSSTTVTSGAVVAAIRNILAHYRWRQGPAPIPLSPGPPPSAVIDFGDPGFGGVWAQAHKDRAQSGVDSSVRGGTPFVHPHHC